MRGRCAKKGLCEPRFVGPSQHPCDRWCRIPHFPTATLKSGDFNLSERNIADPARALIVFCLERLNEPDQIVGRIQAPLAPNRGSQVVHVSRTAVHVLSDLGHRPILRQVLRHLLFGADEQLPEIGRSDRTRLTCLDDFPRCKSGVKGLPIVQSRSLHGRKAEQKGGTPKSRRAESRFEAMRSGWPCGLSSCLGVDLREGMIRCEHDRMRVPPVCGNGFGRSGTTWRLAATGWSGADCFPFRRVQCLPQVENWQGHHGFYGIQDAKRLSS